MRPTGHGYYHDESEIPFTDGEGKFILKDDKMYDLSKCGVLVPENLDRDCTSFASAFARWHKTQTTTTLVISVEKGKVGAVTAALNALGVQVPV